jgi:hypothetical protein
MYGNYTIGGDKCDSRYHVCEVDYDIIPSENFNDNIHFNHKLFFTLVSAILILICIILIYNLIHNAILKGGDKFYNICGIVCLIGLIILNFIIFLYSQKETCGIPHSCYEGKNNKIIPQFYFYQLDECPDEYSWLFYFYDELHPDVNEDRFACENTYYGCCKYYEEVQCIESYSNDLDYDVYKKTTGHWTLGVTMNDQNGTNCPAISEIIYEVSHNKPLSNRINVAQIDIIFLITTFSVMGLYFLCNLCSSKNYNELDEEDQNNGKEEDDKDDDEETVLRASA